MSLCELTPRAIKDAVIAKLREALTRGTVIYEDLVPRNFERPAVLVELIGGAMLPLSAGMHNVPLQWTVRLTGLVETDEVHDSHLGPLDDMGWLLQTMWAEGFLRVAGRALHLDRVQVDSSGYDNVVVTLSLSVQVPRQDLAPQPETTAGVMENVTIQPGNTIIK